MTPNLSNSNFQIISVQVIIFYFSPGRDGGENNEDSSEQDSKLPTPQLFHSKPFKDPVRNTKPKKDKPKKVESDGSKMNFNPSMG